MSNKNKLSAGQRRSGHSFIKDADGQTAVEFGMVALPFLMMIFGVVNSGLYFYTVNSLDRGVEDAARLVRTGEAQKSGMTVGGFKTLVCDKATGIVECDKLTIQLQFAQSWDGITAKSCTTGGDLTAGTGKSTDAISGYTSTQNVVVQVTACYKWELAKYLPFLELGNLSDGSMVIQSSTSFRTEPYT